MRKDIPYFEKAFHQVTAKGKIVRDDPPQRTMVGIEIGEDWTRQFISTQAGFLRRHGQDHALTATWLLALAAASANNDTTPVLLQQACEQGLGEDEIFRIGVSVDSDRCAQFLLDRDVDWSSLYVQPEIGAEIGSNSNANMANDALISHLIYPKEAPRRKTVNLANGLEVLLSVHEHALPVKFIEAIVKSGKVSINTRFKTEAFDLADGKASWVSVAIATGKCKLAAKLLANSNEVSPDILDEALLAIAMTSVRDRMMPDEKRTMAQLAKTLVALGANPDRQFEFGQAGYSALNGWGYNDKKQALTATARQWAMVALLENSQSPGFAKAFLPSPWPKPPGKEGWLEFGLRLLSRRSGSDDSTRTVMDRLLTLSSKEDPIKIESVCRDTWKEKAARGNFAVVDALVESAIMKKALGNVAPESLWLAIQEAGELSKIDKMSARDLGEKFDRWWAHDRLDKVIAWLPEEHAHALAQQLAKAREFALMGKEKRNFQALSEQDFSAVKLALQACFNTPSLVHTMPLAQRRTL
jgi:hypothetical protein